MSVQLQDLTARQLVLNMLLMVRRFTAGAHKAALALDVGHDELSVVTASQVYIEPIGERVA